MTPAELAAAAVSLARSGIAVFPVRGDGTKRPACAHGKDDATCDPVAARRLFLGARAAALIARTTGAAAGVAVIDVDPQGLGWFDRNYRRLMPTRIDQTPRGGVHIFYRWPAGSDLRNSAGKLSHAVDIRAEGGSIIIPPSPGYRTVSGAELSEFREEFAEFPRWVLQALARIDKKRSATLAAEAGRYAGNGELTEASVAGLARTVASAANGERNLVLYWAACRLGEKGGGSDAQAVLVRAAMSAGLDVVEATATLRSGLKTGQRASNGA